MPELPEVEVIKLFLEKKLAGQTITDLEILNRRSFVGNPKLAIGQKIIKFTRLGKQLSIHLSNRLILLVHLKMTGQLLFLPPLSRGGPKGGGVMLGHPTKTINPKSTRIIFHFSPLSSKRGTKGEILYFNDQRKFGWIKLLSQTELVEAQQNLGLDIFDPQFTTQYLFSQFQKTSRPIKLALLDQNKFAGIGNIYANDALFLAGIHPQTPSNHLSLSRLTQLHHHLIEIMHQSVAAGGSTAKDSQYLRPDGSPGQNQFHFRVYDHLNQPCPVCQTPIKRITLGGRGTFFCPHCQPLL